MPARQALLVVFLISFCVPSDAKGELAFVQTPTRSFVGEVIQKTDSDLFLYDLKKHEITAIKLEDIIREDNSTTDTTAIGILGFPKYAAWKIATLAHTGFLIGSVARASETECYVTIGATSKLEVGQRLHLKGPAEVITDPATGKQIGIVRSRLGELEVTEVINANLSECKYTSQLQLTEFPRKGTIVEGVRTNKLIAVMKIEWKTNDENLKQGDDIYKLGEDLLQELVLRGVRVVSQKQVTSVREQLADAKGVNANAISDAEVATKLGCDIVLNGTLLAISEQRAEAKLQVIDARTKEHIGIVAGNIRRDRGLNDIGVWSDKSGKFRVNARYVGVVKQNVILRNPSGIEIRLPIAALSETSRMRAEKLYRASPPAPPKQALADKAGIRFARIAAGKFMKGDVPENEKLEVQIKDAFEIGATEITQSQFHEIMGIEPENPLANGGQLPMGGVTWHDARSFCAKLTFDSLRKGLGYVYRLPTDSEWEYACRAGTDTDFFFGIDYRNEFPKYAWFRDNADGNLRAVAQLRPNPWGLYDVYGNVAEWCENVGGEDADNGVAEALPTDRSVRGGSIFNTPTACRSGKRWKFAPDGKKREIGFRVVRAQIQPGP